MTLILYKKQQKNPIIKLIRKVPGINALVLAEQKTKKNVVVLLDVLK